MCRGCPRLPACPPFTLVEERVRVPSHSTWTAAVQAGSGSIFARDEGGGGRGGEQPREGLPARSERKREQGRIVCVGITMYVRLCGYVCVCICIYIGYTHTGIFVFVYGCVSSEVTSRTGRASRMAHEQGELTGRDWRKGISRPRRSRHPASSLPESEAAATSDCPISLPWGIRRELGGEDRTSRGVTLDSLSQ